MEVSRAIDLYLYSLRGSDAWDSDQTARPAGRHGHAGSESTDGMFCGSIGATQYAEIHLASEVLC